jgi:hypothetical protein
MSDPLLSRLPVVRAPDEIWNLIEAALQTPKPERRRPRQWFRWVWLPATAVLLVVVLWWSHRPHGARWGVVRTTGSQPGKTETIGAGELLQTDAPSER